MKAHSQDLRQRVLQAIHAGQSQVMVAKTFSVSVAPIKRYLKQRRERGGYCAPETEETAQHV